MSVPHRPEGVPLPDELLRVVADLAAVNTEDGLVPGSGALRIEMSPLQLAAFATVLPGRAMLALGLALHHGTLRTDPIRVEVLGWGRDWLIKHGMNANQARLAIKDLLDAGITVSTYGPDGPSGNRVGIIGADRCGWSTPDLVILPGAAGRRTQSDTRAGQQARLAQNTPGGDRTGPDHENAQVTTLGVIHAKGGEAVDNTLGAKHAKGSNPVDKPLGAKGAKGQPGTPGTYGSGVNMQVSPSGAEHARQPAHPATSSSVSEKRVLSAPVVLTSSSLTLADVHELLTSAALHGAAVAAGDGLLVHLTDIFGRADRDRVAAAVDFHGYQDTGQPHMVMAALITQVVQTAPTDRDDLVEDLFGRCRAGNALLTRPPAPEFLAAWLLTMTGAMSTTPHSWGAWVYSGIRRPDWNVSSVMRDVVATLAHLAEHGTLSGVPAPGDGPGSPAGGRDCGNGRGPDLVRRDPVTGEWPEQVVAELREAVARTPFADELSFEQGLANAAWVNKTLTRWRERAGAEVVTDRAQERVEEEPSDEVRASGQDHVEDESASPGEESGMSAEERLVAHAEMLASLVEGTRWADEDEWARLLANPDLQTRLLRRHRVNQALIASGGKPLPLDTIA